MASTRAGVGSPAAPAKSPVYDSAESSFAPLDGEARGSVTRARRLSLMIVREGSGAGGGSRVPGV